MKEILDYQGTQRAILSGLRSGVTVLIEGPPGCGKTANVRQTSAIYAKEREWPVNGKPCRELIGANSDPTDSAGLPYLLPDGKVGRALFPEIQACVEAPGVLFLDELTTCPTSVRAGFLRLMLEHNAGGTPLHPESRIVAACNAPEHAPNATELDAASVGRIMRIHYAPSIGEISGYFSGIADPTWSAEALDFAATIAADPTLIQIEPPSASIEQGAAWGAPRSWELALRSWAADGSQEDSTGYAILAGCVGSAQATAFLAIRKLRHNLPTVEQIEADPIKALVPDRPDMQIAALGVVSRVARGDKSAAWCYTERLRPEIAAAISKMINNVQGTKPDKFAAQANKARIKLLAKFHRAAN